MPIDRTTDREDWIAVAEPAGVRRLRIHDLRHTAVTLLLLRGVSEHDVMQIMGWSSRVMIDRYAHLVPESRDRVAELQEELFGGDENGA